MKSIVGNIGTGLFALLLAACSGSDEPAAPAETTTVLPPPAAAKVSEPESEPELAAAIHRSPNKNAYFGNLHIHTAWSFDGFTNGSITAPDDAYRWAKGEAIPGGGGGADLKIKVPLDFYAVSEHAEYMGVFVKMADPDNPISQLSVSKKITSDDQTEAFAAFAAILDDMNRGVSQPDLSDPTLAASLWDEIVEIAEAHNAPGSFTTFPAFEWTSAPDNRNLHRVVVFKTGDNTPKMPYSTLDSDKPEDLWQYMDEARTGGASVLAIPHNGNASDGLMFSLTDSRGEPLGSEYAEQRMRNEPLYEVSQIKGTSEVHPMLSPNDEYAAFEQWDYTLSAITERPTKHHGSFARQAFLDGISLEAAGVGNPFKMGLIGDSDGHNSAAVIEEDNYTGKFGMENNPEHRLNGPLPNEANNQQIREFSSGGVAGIWAEANTREDIFNAMVRKETFGTSGTRMKVRMFAGWGYAASIFDSAEWVEQAYAGGVPMGGDLSPAAGDTAPIFVIAAMKEADGANLDRIQVIKGWVEDGEFAEKIYNVVLSGGRKVDAEGNVPEVGNTVDASKASYSNSIGEAELRAIWTDPDFETGQHAFYYARVLEIPTPRWSTYDAVALGIEPRKDLPVSIQERAWTSPIWYTPEN